MSKFLLKWRHLVLITSLLVVSAAPMSALASPPSQGGATPIRYGETLQGEITTETAIVRYQFNGQNGDTISAIVTATDFDVFVTLTTAEGTLLNSDDNGAGGTDAQMVTTLPADGTYLLNVSRSPTVGEDSVGQFTISLIAGAAPQPTATESLDDVTSEPDTTLPPTPVPTTPPVTPTINTEARLQNIRPGTVVTGSFSGTDDLYVYWFEGDANRQLRFQADITEDITPLLVLYRSNMEEIVRAQPGNPLDVTLDQTDVYFLVAASLETNATGRFDFTFEDNTPVDTSTLDDDVLLYGQSKTGNISNSNPTERYLFEGEAGDTVTLTMAVTGGDLDSYLLLVDSSGATLAEDDNSGPGELDANLSLTLPTSGQYFVIATRRNQETGLTTGTYALTIAADAPPRIPTDDQGDLPADYIGLPQIAYGETVTGEISNEAYFNIWVFSGQSGDNIIASMQADESNLDPLLILLDEDRIPLAEHDDIVQGVQRDSLLEFALPEDGYYAIVATRFDQATGTSVGSYELSLTLEGAAPDNSGLPLTERLRAIELTAGETPTGEFVPLRMAQVYTFPAAEDQIIDFAITTDSGNDATLILTDSNLQPVADSDNGILLAINAPANDDYFVFVLPERGPTANVEDGYVVALNLEVSGSEGGVVVSSEPISIAYGSAVEGQITNVLSAQQYTFVGRNGDVVEITMEADGQPVVDTLLQLADADEEVIAENDDIEPGVVRDSRIRTTLPADGEYTIIATRYEGNDVDPTVGRYRLSLTAQDPATVGVDQAAETIRYGEVVTDEITEDTFLKFFFFVGTQGDEIAIRVNTTEGNLDAIAYLYTFTSDNEPFLLIANDDSPLGGTYDPYIEYTLPRSGPYLIGITRYQDAESERTTGTFDLSVELIGTPESSANGQDDVVEEDADDTTPEPTPEG